MQLFCFPNAIQYMKPVLPVGQSMHKIPNGYRTIWISVFTCNPQNCRCPDNLNNCNIFLATLKRDQAPPNQFLWWQLPHFSGQLCGLMGAGKNPNALPFLYQKGKLPLGTGQPSSSSAYLGWKLNKISLPGEPAFRRGRSRGHWYKRRPREQQQLCRRLRVWKNNRFLSSLSSSSAGERCHSQAPSSYTKDIQFCHHPQARGQSQSFPGEGGLPAGLSQASEIPSHHYLGFKALKGECPFWSTIKSSKLLVQMGFFWFCFVGVFGLFFLKGSRAWGFVHFLTHEKEVFQD